MNDSRLNEDEVRRNAEIARIYTCSNLRRLRLVASRGSTLIYECPECGAKVARTHAQADANAPAPPVASSPGPTKEGKQ